MLVAMLSTVVLVLVCLAESAFSLNIPKNFKNEVLLSRASRQINWNSQSPASRLQQQNSNFFNSNNNEVSWSKEDAGGFIFEDEYEQRRRNANSRQRTRTTTPRVEVPGMGTRKTLCENLCLTTPEYNPVCGSDGMSYFSLSKLHCAQKCGKRVGMKHLGACSSRST